MIIIWAARQIHCWQREGKLSLQGINLSTALASAFNLPSSAIDISPMVTNTENVSLKISPAMRERAQKRSNSRNTLPRKGKNVESCQCQCLPDLRSHFPEWQVGWNFLGRVLCRKQCRLHSPKSRCYFPRASAISWQALSSYFPFLNSSEKINGKLLTRKKLLHQNRTSVLDSPIKVLCPSFSMICLFFN